MSRTLGIIKVYVRIYASMYLINLKLVIYRIDLENLYQVKNSKQYLSTSYFKWAFNQTVTYSIRVNLVYSPCMIRGYYNIGRNLTVTFWLVFLAVFKYKKFIPRIEISILREWLFIHVILDFFLIRSWNSLFQVIIIFLCDGFYDINYIGIKF